MWFDDLVIIAKVSHPIPFRTRSLNPLALMVLRLKARESKSLPDLPNIPLPCLCLLYISPLSKIRDFCYKTKQSIAFLFMDCFSAKAPRNDKLRGLSDQVGQ